MERKEKKSDPTQLIIDGAAYFIVISSVFYVVYTSMGSGAEVTKEQLKVKPGWTAHTEVHQKPKAKPNWSLFPDPVEVVEKSAVEEKTASLWQFFGTGDEKLESATQEVKPVTKTVVVSKVEEPSQTKAPVEETVFISDQEDDDISPPSRPRNPEPEDYWSFFAPNPVKESKPNPKSKTRGFADQETENSESVGEKIQKSAESFWNSLTVEREDFEPSHYEPPKEKKVKSKAKQLDSELKKPKKSSPEGERLKSHRPNVNERADSVELEDSDMESDRNLRDDNEDIKKLLTPEVLALLKNMLYQEANPASEDSAKFVEEENDQAFIASKNEEPVLVEKNSEKLPKGAGAWFGFAPKRSEQTFETSNQATKKLHHQQKASSWDSFFVQDTDDSYSWLVPGAPSQRKQEPQKDSSKPASTSFSGQKSQRKEVDGDSWFAQDVDDDWLVSNVKPQNSAQKKPFGAQYVKPAQQKRVPVGDSLFVEEVEDSWLAGPKNPKYTPPKSTSLKDLLTTGIYFSGSEAKPSRASPEGSKGINSKKSQLVPPKSAADLLVASEDWFDKITLKKAYQFFDRFFKLKESSPVKEKIQNIFVSEVKDDTIQNPKTQGSDTPKSQNFVKKEKSVNSYERLLNRLRNLVIAYQTLIAMHDPTLADVENTLLEVMLENGDDVNVKAEQAQNVEHEQSYEAREQEEKPLQRKVQITDGSFLVEDVEESWLATGEHAQKQQAPPKQAPQPSFKKPVQNRHQGFGDSILVEDMDDSWLATETPQPRKQAPPQKTAQQSFKKPSQQKRNSVEDSWLGENTESGSWFASKPNHKRTQGNPSKVVKEKVNEQVKPKKVNFKKNVYSDKLFVSDEDTEIIPDGKPQKKGVDWSIQPKVYKSRKIQNDRNGLDQVVDSAYHAVVDSFHVPILDSIKPKVYKTSNVQAKQQETAKAKENAYKAVKNLINSIF